MSDLHASFWAIGGSVCGEAMSGWGWWQVNGGNDGWGGNGPLSGARVGDRFALALISLALDEVDATELLGGRR